MAGEVAPSPKRVLIAMDGSENAEQAFKCVLVGVSGWCRVPAFQHNDIINHAGKCMAAIWDKENCYRNVLTYIDLLSQNVEKMAAMRQGGSHNFNTLLNVAETLNRKFVRLPSVHGYMDVCHRQGNRVILCHVADYKGLVHMPIMSPDPNLVQKMVCEEENRIKLVIAKLTEMVKRAMVDGKVIRCTGEPGETVVRTAKEQEVNYIVTGSRGLGKIRRTFLGSTSDYILHHSHIPVLIVQKSD